MLAIILLSAIALALLILHFICTFLLLVPSICFAIIGLMNKSGMSQYEPEIIQLVKQALVCLIPEDAGAHIHPFAFVMDSEPESRRQHNIETSVGNSSLAYGAPAPGGVGSAPSSGGTTGFSTFMRRRQPELRDSSPQSGGEAPVDKARSPGLGPRNVRANRAPQSPRGWDFSSGTAIRIDSSTVEMPTVMINGRDNVGPTQQVTYASGTYSRTTERPNHQRE